MQRYANLSGNSGVARYRIADGWMDIQFVNGDIYRYDIGRIGKRHFEKMQTLAKRGRGLAAYISRHVHDSYSSKCSARSMSASRRNELPQEDVPR